MKNSMWVLFVVTVLLVSPMTAHAQGLDTRSFDGVVAPRPEPKPSTQDNSQTRPNKNGVDNGGARAYSNGVPPPWKIRRAQGYYLQLRRLNELSISDSYGNTDVFFQRPFIPSVRQASYPLTDKDNFFAVLSVSETYQIKFKVDSPTSIELVKGVGNAKPDEAIRYRDLNLPRGVAALLQITPQGVDDLRYDADGDGVYESVVKPTSSVVGSSARDTTGPIIKFVTTKTDAVTASVTITAEDENSVKAIYYSFDGASFYKYERPLRLSLNRFPVVYAFADDNLGNRRSADPYPHRLQN
ncbi:MAG: hypothetical protein MSG64_07230 [Pyrinomonadaceae bacterium MAG19_C2-C3]|nr:hypothetical protein [Pyrinomonadaceae bacterium MAG19_C2-C3]